MIGNDPTSDQTGYLPDEHFAAGRIEAYRRLLVIQTRFLCSGMPELTGIVLPVGDGAVRGVAVNMTVEHVHENRDPDRSVLEERWLIGLQNTDDLAIRRSKDEAVATLSGTLRNSSHTIISYDWS